MILITRSNDIGGAACIPPLLSSNRPPVSNPTHRPPHHDPDPDLDEPDSDEEEEEDETPCIICLW